MHDSPKTIIGVPGRWESRNHIVTSIAEKSGGYLFSGDVLLQNECKEHFSLEVYEHDDTLSDAFAIAGRGRLADEDIQKIALHTHCLYIVGKGGTFERASSFMKAASALLASGGVAVKIESAGTAHSAAGWNELMADGSLGALLRTFVTYIGRSGFFYSCGMKNLGFPDCVVEAHVVPNEAAKLIHTFLGYLLAEQPQINSGETFSRDPDAPYYRLTAEACTMFSADDPFHNPFGVWKLSPV